MINKESITRRDFIRLSSSLMAAALITIPGFTHASVHKYKMGLQLFTVREPLANDVTGTFKKIAAIGYEDCETYGFNPDNGTYYVKATAFKQLLADNNMITTSGHCDFAKYFDKPADDLMRYVDQCQFL